MDWNSLPDWLSSVSSLAGLSFAAVAAVAALRIYKIETDRDLAADKERKKSQAALVSAWWGWADREGGRGKGDWGTYVRNASETPVYKASLFVLDIRDHGARELFELPVVAPGTDPQFIPSALHAADPADCRVEISFTDSSGSRWLRDKQGSLDELKREVRIWGEPKRAAALQKLVAGFLTFHGVTAKFRTGKIEDLYEELVSADEAMIPDIVIGPHDWLGGLVERGLIEPLPLSRPYRKAFEPVAIEAMTYNGELYGIPVAFDTAAILRNTALAPEQPASFEAMLEAGRAVRDRGDAELPLAMQVPDPYYMYPVILAAGGEVFGRTEAGLLDPTVLNVNTQATRQAFERFRSLGPSGLGYLSHEIDREKAIELFASGQAPFLLCASRVIGEARKAQIDFVVDPIPPYTGFDPVRPMVSVHGLYLTRRANNKVVARDLIVDHLTHPDVAADLFEVWPHVPVLRESLERISGGDPAIRGFFDACGAGDPMPSVPRMVNIWRALRDAEIGLLDGANTNTTVRQLSKKLADLID